MTLTARQIRKARKIIQAERNYKPSYGPPIWLEMGVAIAPVIVVAAIVFGLKAPFEAFCRLMSQPIPAIQEKPGLSLERRP